MVDNAPGVGGSVPPLDRATDALVLRLASRRAGHSLAALLAVMGLIACAPAEQANWRPTSEVTGSGLGQGPATFAEVLGDVAQMYDIQDPPPVEVIHEITPAESKKVLDDCLAERGWTMVNGSFQFPGEQHDAFKLDSYVCIASYPIRAEYLTPMDDAGWRRVYDYWVRVTVPCLTQHGIDVPEPPSIETFLETRSWTPDGDEVRDQIERLVSIGKFPDVEHVFQKICPVSPPPEVRFGQ